MQLKNFIYKLLLSACFGASTALASFEVDPLKVNLQLGQNFATLNVINSDKPQLFFLTLTDGKFDQSNTRDLSFSPTSFRLSGQQIQVVRITTKPGVNYTGKKYALFVVAARDDANAVIKNSFKIPITVVGSSAQAAPTQTPQVRVDDFEDNLSGLTQIRISVPVSAVVQ